MPFNHKYLPVIFITFFTQAAMCQDSLSAWIRIYQLGYLLSAIKVAVWVSKTAGTIDTFRIINATTGEVAFTGRSGKLYGSYGPFV